MKADLHIHSTISDGSEDIVRIIEMAKEKKLDAIAITDHDTVAHFSRIPLDSEIKVIAGVEISAFDKENSTRAHVLGFNIKEPSVIQEFSEPFLEMRNQNSEKQVGVLIDNGFKIDIDKLPRADGKYLYKQHIMDYLVSTGQAPDMFGEFYHRTFKNGGICAFDIEYIDVFKAVAKIKEAGGYAVLAHPGQQQNYYLIPELKRVGLDGIELNHHTHSERDREIIRECALKHGLFMTGGSDYHGRFEPQPYVIGDFLSDESGVLALFR